MPYDIKLPGGKVVPNVPDDMDPNEAVAEWSKSYRAALKAQYDSEVANPAEGMGKGRQFAAGLARGVENFTRRAGNLITPDSINQGTWFSDQAIEDQSKLFKGLDSTGAGATGKFVGELAPGLAVSGMGGVAARALGGAINASRGAGLAARALAVPGVKTALAASRAAVDGGLNSAILADPDERKSAATTGALLGAGLNVVGRAGGRLVRGLAKKSDDALHLEQIAAQNGVPINIPVAQAAGDVDLPTRVTKQIYGEFLPIVPGASGKLIRQADEAKAAFREIAAKEDMPPGVINRLNALPGKVNDNLRAAGRAIKEGLDEEFADSIDGYSFKLFKNSGKVLRSEIRGEYPDIDRLTLRRTVRAFNRMTRRMGDEVDSKTLEIPGYRMRQMRTMVEREIKGAPNEMKPAWIKVKQFVDKEIERQMSTTAQGVDDFGRFQHALDSYGPGVAFRKAVKASRGKAGEFTPQKLATYTGDSNPHAVALADSAIKTVGKNPSKSTFVGRAIGNILGYGAIVGGGVAGGLPGAIAGTGVIGAGNLLASKGAQRAVMGNTRAQQALIRSLRNNPRAHELLNRAARLSATNPEDE